MWIYDTRRGLCIRKLVSRSVRGIQCIKSIWIRVYFHLTTMNCRFRELGASGAVLQTLSRGNGLREIILVEAGRGGGGLELSIT
jgi:hypothetical protein